MDDLISRQAAMERLMVQNVIMDGSEYHNGFNAGVNRAQEVIRNLPPVQPKRMKGRWLPDNNFAYEMRFVCSVCKESEVVPTIGFKKYKPIWNFCPNCGADMRGEQDE